MRVVVFLLAAAQVSIAAPVARPAPRPVPHPPVVRPPIHIEPPPSKPVEPVRPKVDPLHPEGRREEWTDRSYTTGPGGERYLRDGRQAGYSEQHYPTGRDAASSADPIRRFSGSLFFALPVEAGYKNVFGREFTRARSEEIEGRRQDAEGLLKTHEASISRSWTSPTFTRAELLEAVRSLHPGDSFILVCHSEGPPENRVIPLGDGNGEVISEKDLRKECADARAELILVSCKSVDLGISRDIDYKEAFRIVAEALKEIESGGATARSVDHFKKALKKAAILQTGRGFELTISMEEIVGGAIMILVITILNPADDDTGQIATGTIPTDPVPRVPAQAAEPFNWRGLVCPILMLSAVIIPFVRWLNGPMT